MLLPTTQENSRIEHADYASFLDSFIQTKRRKKKLVPRIVPLYKRKNIPVHQSGIKDEITHALEQHIEGMEPHFRSASFQQLWQELREPLTDVMRPRKLEEMLSDLDKCNLGNVVHPYEFPTDVDGINRDLAICKIGEILEKNTETSPYPENKGNYAHLWSMLKNPLTSCFNVAQLSSLMDELAQCLPRFELAGIKYEVPSKMSEVKRDVVICKVDEVLNTPYNYEDSSGNGKQDN